MKNKKTTYLLIGLTVVVWGLIVYRIISHFSADTDVGAIQPGFSDNSFLLPEEDSSYTLKLNYKDPFLKGGYSAQKSVSRKIEQTSGTDMRRRVRQINNPTINKQIVNWPAIEFGGIILNDKTNEKLGLISVSNESYLFRKGEERNDLQLVELYSDSVVVNYQQEIKTIYKSN